MGSATAGGSGPAALIPVALYAERTGAGIVSVLVSRALCHKAASEYCPEQYSSVDSEFEEHKTE